MSNSWYGSTCGEYRVVFLVTVFKLSAFYMHLYKMADSRRHTYSFGSGGVGCAV